jgi:hypothetical protein
MTEIIIFKEKHSDRYYIAETPEQKAKAFLKVLRERNAQGYWYHEPTEPVVTLSDYDRAFTELSDEEVANLPEAIKAEAVQSRSRATRRQIGVQAEYKRDKFWWDQLQELLALPEDEAVTKVAGARQGVAFSLAEDLLDAHADYEYEGYAIVHSNN